MFSQNMMNNHRVIRNAWHEQALLSLESFGLKKKMLQEHDEGAFVFCEYHYKALYCLVASRKLSIVDALARIARLSYDELKEIVYLASNPTNLRDDSLKLIEIDRRPMRKP